MNAKLTFVQNLKKSIKSILIIDKKNFNYHKIAQLYVLNSMFFVIFIV